MKLARLLGKPKQTVNHYKVRVPEEACPLIEMHTGVRVEDMRGDLVWHRIPCEGWPNGSKPLLDHAPQEA